MSTGPGSTECRAHGPECVSPRECGVLIDDMAKPHFRSEHWFRCGACGYIGTEDELPDDPRHSCGKDECPECKRPWCITCCYETREAAENDYATDAP